MSELRIHRVVSAREPEFRELLRIYEEAIPASERKSAFALAEMAMRPEYLFLTIGDEYAVVGFSIAMCFEDAALLEYMAVDATERGKGIGAELFRQTVARPELCDRFVLIEVESEAEDREDRGERMRRKNFYRRLGCRQIEGLQYRMPQVSSAEPPPMDMMMYRSVLPDAVSRADVRRWIEACYCRVYGKQSDDPRIDEMVARLPEQVRLI